jgi:heme-degrading monooxygenase HmoA
MQGGSFLLQGATMASSHWIGVGVLSLVVVLALAIPGCQAAAPFRGPGAANPKAVSGVGETVVVAVTHAVLDGSNRRPFDEYSAKVVRSLPSQDGFVGYSLRSRIAGNEVWTMTVWRDEAALDAFVSSEAHEAAIASGLQSVVSGQFTRFECPVDDCPPKWSSIMERLKSVRTIEYRKEAGARSTTATE